MPHPASKGGCGSFVRLDWGTRVVPSTRWVDRRLRASATTWPRLRAGLAACALGRKESGFALHWMSSMGWNEGARSYISNSTRYVSSTPITGRHAHKAARHGLFSGGTVSMRLTFFDLFDLFDTAWPAATWTATPAGGDNHPEQISRPADTQKPSAILTRAGPNGDGG